MGDGLILNLNEEKIKICRNVMCILYKYVQKSFFSKESGGILIGKENKSNKNIIINHITIPLPKDKRRRNSFLRKDKGHIELFEKLYIKSDETLRYIGEWHTHPEAIPNFSSIDLENWKKISKESNNDNNYYHIIVGYKTIRVWKVNNNMFQAKLISTIFWKDTEQG